MRAVERAACDRRVDPLERRRRRDEPIAAEGEPRTGIEQRTKGVCAFASLMTNHALRPPAVVDGVIWLDAGDDAERPEASDVGRRDVLRVLDPEAAIARPSGSGDALVDVGV